MQLVALRSLVEKAPETRGATNEPIGDSAWNGEYLSDGEIDVILQGTHWWPYLLCTCFIHP